MQTQRLLESYGRATQFQRDEGLRWYRTVRSLCIDISVQYEIPLFQVVGILVALSPRNRFGRNVRDTIAIITKKESAVVATFGANKYKALAILETKSSDDVLRVLKGDKVSSFFTNIYQVRDSAVTIDVWMMRLLGIQGAITPKKYEQATNAVRDVASMLGIQPKQLQAITWIEQRNNAY